MAIVQDVVQAVQALLNDIAEEVAKECDVIKRRRKFTGALLAQTFVLGFLQKPNASDEDLAQMAGILGVQVTAQAVEQRYSSELVDFLEGLFRRAISTVLQSQKSLAPILDQFTDVLLLDSTTFTLPPELAELFPGCGGSYGAGKAAVKFQVQFSLKTGALDTIKIEPGRDCDQKTSLQDDLLESGTLRIADLGYFDTEVFERYGQDGVYWLSRLMCGTNTYSVDDERLDLMEWLAAKGPLVDDKILVGAKRKLECRIIAWRVPEEVANRRRQKVIAEHSRKGRTPSAERLAWCDWMVLITNVPVEMLSPEEACVFYRSRWQIELVFKRWKSQGMIADLQGSTVNRKMVRVWVRLLAVIVQHWLLLTSVWGDRTKSLTKACEAIRKFAVSLAVAINDVASLCDAIELIRQTTHSTVRQNKRKNPSTFDLLNDAEILEYSLT